MTVGTPERPSRTPRRLSAAAVGLCLVVAVACQGAGGHVRGNAALTGSVSGETVLSVASVHQLLPIWRSTEEVGGPDDSLTVHQNRVYTPTGSFNVNAVGCTGDGPGVLECAPTTTFAGTAVSAPGGSSPTELGERTYLLPPSSTAAATPTFAAYPAAAVPPAANCTAGSCVPIWEADISAYDPAGTANVGGRGAATVVDDTVYVSSESTGHLFAFPTDITSCAGTIPKQCAPVWAADGIATAQPPAVVGGTAYVATATTGTRAAGIAAYLTDDLTGCTGSPLLCEPTWTAELGATIADPATIGPPIVSGYYAYVVADATVYAFSSKATSGCSGSPKVCTPLWTVSLPAPLATQAAPALAGTKLYVPSSAGITVVDTTAASLVTTFPWPGVLMTATAAGITVANGVVYAGTTDGLVAYDAACTASCTALVHRLVGHHVTTPAIAAGKVHVLADGTAYALAAVAEPAWGLTLGTTNYLGTGSLLTGPAGTVTQPERRWLAISGTCVDKGLGDRYAARWANNSTNTCSGTPNSEYDDTNYQYVITVPPNRVSPIDVVLYNGNYNSGDSVTSEGNSGGGSGPSLRTTFALFTPDATPLDDTDNPIADSTGTCADATSGINGTKTFAPGVPEDNYSLAITNVTNRAGMWRLCTIPVSAPSGRYLLRVRNQESPTGPIVEHIGMNYFSVFALPTSPTPSLCTVLTDPTCPTVTADRTLDLYNTTVGGTSVELSIATIDPELRGRRVAVELWDTAEGSTGIELLTPSGPNAWVTSPFDYAVDGVPVAAGVTSITNGGAVLPYNSKLLTLTFTVPADTDATTYPWRLRYTFASSSMSDRTTWTVRVLP